MTNALMPACTVKKSLKVIKTEIRFQVYNDRQSTTEIICCGQPMKYRDGKPKHWNDMPHTFRCEKCGRWFKGNVHSFDVPRPKHVSITLKEVKSKNKR